MKGTVYKSTGSWYVVKNPEGEVFNARLKGKFKIDGITSTNPIAVGDEVEFEIEDAAEKRVMITGLEPRKNYVNRVSPSNRRLHHIVASNMDQSLLVATIKDPKTSIGFIDRFLVTCEAFHIPAIIVFNKADIYGPKEMDVLEERKSMYASVGYEVLLTSVKDATGMELLRKKLQSKVTLLSGHSGVGKSSLINEILGDANIRTNEVSEWSGKGMHTTTFAEMYDLPNGGKLIDTPGMREFAIADISKDELSHYYPEMRALLNDCQFNNCMHMNEPGCAIKQGVMDGKIHEDRYISYCTILDSIEEKTSW
ncbi:MAG: ribosome small subunit-dependent GTPase A [Chitinophagia bacterium]|nr:ribosome small subunit-dependent GTPase A [Chitinophagia bacterium]